jgi:hypothetical protein
MQANAVQRTAEEGCLPILYITLQQKGLHLHVHPRLALERNLDIRSTYISCVCACTLCMEVLWGRQFLVPSR